MHIIPPPRADFVYHRIRIIREKNKLFYDSKRLSERSLFMYYDPIKAGTLIRELRIRRNMSQEVLSGLAGIARSHLSAIESGKKTANVDTLWRITHALGIRLSNFIQTLEDITDN